MELNTMASESINRQTKQLLAGAVLELLDKKPLDKITVNDVVECCGVSRRTFYNHFTDIYDAFMWNGRDKWKKYKKDEHDFEEFFKGVLTNLDDTKIGRALATSTNSAVMLSPIRDRFFEVINNTLFSMKEEYEGVTEEDIVRIANIYASGWTGVVHDIIRGKIGFSQEDRMYYVGMLTNDALSMELERLEKKYRTKKKQPY